MNKPVILCVDDERIILDALKSQLRHQFGGAYHIEVAESGEEALEIFEDLRQQHVALPLVISDQIMGGMYGDVLLASIKQQSPHTMSIMLTGQATAESIGKAVNTAGLFRYLSKPWNEEDLLMTVQAALEAYLSAETLQRQSAYQKILNEVLQLALSRDSLRDQMAHALEHVLRAPDFQPQSVGALYLSGHVLGEADAAWSCVANRGPCAIDDSLLTSGQDGVSACGKEANSQLELLSVSVAGSDKNVAMLFVGLEPRAEHADNLRAFLQSIAHALAGMIRMAEYYQALESHSASLETVVAARTDELHEALRQQAHQNASLQSLNQELEYYATTDDLTGLRNRRCFFEQADKEVARAHRYARPTVLVMMDIDHFKEVNDQYGHQVGDEVLRAAARIVRENVRSHDIVGRVGGEEFAIVMPETQLDEGRELCERLRRAIATNKVNTHGHHVAVTISMGLSSVAPKERGVGGAMIRADQALYDAKHQGRDQIVMG